MHPWVFFQVAVVLVVAGSGRFKWLTAIFAIWWGLISVPIWLASIQVVSAGVGIWLAYQIDSDWGRGEKKTCHNCGFRGYYPRNAEITICKCGYKEGRNQSIWYFRCSCHALNIVESLAKDAPNLGDVIICGDCRTQTTLSPSKDLDDLPRWRLEAANANKGLWFLDPESRRVHRQIKKFYKSK